MEKSPIFTFPEHYNWPCFFTVQVNSDTRDKQLKLWQELICAYSEANKIHTWGVNELHASELCCNKMSNRKLSRKDFDIVVEYLVKTGNLRWHNFEIAVFLVVQYIPLTSS